MTSFRAVVGSVTFERDVVAVLSVGNGVEPDSDLALAVLAIRGADGEVVADVGTAFVDAEQPIRTADPPTARITIDRRTLSMVDVLPDARVAARSRHSLRDERAISAAIRTLSEIRDPSRTRAREHARASVESVARNGASGASLVGDSGPPVRADVRRRDGAGVRVTALAISPRPHPVTVRDSVAASSLPSPRAVDRQVLAR